MGSKRSNAVVFKDYHQNQTNLFPLSLDELIAEHHPVRIVSRVIDTIDIEPIRKLYKGGGTSAYHPRLLLKILVYGYLTNVYSSRKLEENVRQNIHFMWLAGMKTPDHHTINRFRGEKLTGTLKAVFGQIVQLLAAEGLISLTEAVFVDGTKIESAANRYTFVWGKAIKASRERIAKQLDELWQYTQRIANEELKDKEEVIFTPITREKVEQTIHKIDEALADKDVPGKVKQKLRYAKKEWPSKLDQYDEHEKILNGRNSYSKTDPDATFMRLKDDHMRNGQLKPAYNLQISTQDQFILNYSLHHNPTDTRTLPGHLNGYKELYNQLPKILVADAGYGSSENYSLLESNEIESYVKYPSFDKEQKPVKKNQPTFGADQFLYDEEDGIVYCPIGEPMTFTDNIIRKMPSGYVKTISQFESTDCSNCPLKNLCNPEYQNRYIEIDLVLRHYKTLAREKLTSEQGIQYRKKRGIDVEPVFGNIKSNHHYKRFLLKGLNKTEVEIGLLAIAQNFRKWQA